MKSSSDYNKEYFQTNKAQICKRRKILQLERKLKGLESLEAVTHHKILAAKTEIDSLNDAIRIY